MSTSLLRRRTLLDADIVATFVAIAETGNFTRAAERIGRTPAAVSMQIKKLEGMLGRQFLIRDARNVSLTPDGETLLGYARRMLKLNDEAVARFRMPAVEGVVRLGSIDDYGTRFLPDILCRFATTHPSVQVDVELAGSSELSAAVDEGKIDLALVTADKGMDVRGEILLTEPLVWAGLREGCAHQSDPLPLAVSVDTCSWRGAAIRALTDAGRTYRIAYTSGHCSGQEAALMADLAIAPFPRSLVRPPLRELRDADRLPPIGHYHIVLQRASGLGDAAIALANHVVESFVDTHSTIAA